MLGREEREREGEMERAETGRETRRQGEKRKIPLRPALSY